MNELMDESSTRSDAILLKIYRHISQIPLALLQYYGSKNHYKSGKLKNFLKSYTETFKKCFLVIIKEQVLDVDLLDLFMGFITLHFSQNKVVRILEICLTSSIISKEKFEKIFKMLKLARSKSKKKIKILYKENIALRAIIQNLPNLLSPLIQGTVAEQECLSTVLGKITSGDF